MTTNNNGYKIVTNSFTFTSGKLSQYLYFVLFLLISCSNKEKIPKDVLPQERMQAVLWSMINAGEFLNGYVFRDSVDRTAESSKVYGQVFQIHRITREEFDKSYSYYRQHPQLMKVILDSLSKKQTLANEQMQKKQDTIQKKLDTIPRKILREAEAN